MRTLIVRLISLFCIGAGAITLPLPIPLGIPLLAVGFALLLTTSNRARAWLRHRRRRSDWLDGNLLRVEPVCRGVCAPPYPARRRSVAV